MKRLPSLAMLGVAAALHAPLGAQTLPTPTATTVTAFPATGALRSPANFWTANAEAIASAISLSSYQPRDSDLDAISALTTTSFGRGLLEQADAAATLTTLTAADNTLSNLSARSTSGISYSPTETVSGVLGRGRMIVGTKPSLIATDGAVVVARLMSGNAALGAHAFRDESAVDVTGWGLTGYTSYDTLATMTASSGTLSHLTGFQSRPIFGGGGATLLSAIQAFDSGPVAAGPVSAVYGLRIRDVQIGSGGSVSVQYGVFIPALSGATNNIGLWVASISQFAAQVQVIPAIESNSPTTGALRVTQGGIGASGNIHAGGLINSGSHINAMTEYRIANTKVIGARQTGWTAATGTAEKGSFATYETVDISATPTEAEVQALSDALQSASRRIKAMEDAMRAHGLIN